MASAALATRDEAWLVRAIDRYHEICADPSLAGPDVVGAFAAQQTVARLTFDGRILCRSLRPAFVSAQSLEELRNAVSAFWSAIGVIEQRALTDPTLAAELGLSWEERELIAIDPGYDDATVVSRLDTFFGIHPTIIEYNADSPAGMSYQAAQAAIMRRLPAFERFASEYRLEELPANAALRETILEVWREFASRKMISKPMPVVAIVDLAGAATSPEFSLIERDFASHGVHALIATPEDLHYEQGELRAFGKRIDLVYKRLLVADFLARYDLGHSLIKAYADGAVCVASSFRCTIAHKKRALSVLFDQNRRSWFSQAQQSAIGRLVARTWPYRAFDRKTLGQERNELVLKPNDAHGGENVFLGWECDASRWSKAMETAAAGDYVIQRRVAAPVGTYPVFDPLAPERGTALASFIEDRNAYVFRGVLGGVLTRLSDSGVINVSLGGQAIPTFVIYPQESA